MSILTAYSRHLKIPLTQAIIRDTLNRNSSVYTSDHAFNWVNVARHYWEAAVRNSYAQARNRGGGTQFLGKSFLYKSDSGTIEGLYSTCISTYLQLISKTGVFLCSTLFFSFPFIERISPSAAWVKRDKY